MVFAPGFIGRVPSKKKYTVSVEKGYFQYVIIFFQCTYHFVGVVCHFHLQKNCQHIVGKKRFWCCKKWRKQFAPDPEQNATMTWNNDELQGEHLRVVACWAPKYIHTSQIHQGQLTTGRLKESDQAMTKDPVSMNDEVSQHRKERMAK